MTTFEILLLMSSPIRAFASLFPGSRAADLSTSGSATAEKSRLQCRWFVHRQLPLVLARIGALQNMPPTPIFVVATRCNRRTCACC